MHELITEIREKLQMTKTQLAAELDCSPAQVTRLEDGDRTPNPAIMARLWALCPQELRPALQDEALRQIGIPVAYVKPATCPDCGTGVMAVTKDASGERCRECPKCGARFVEEA